MNQRYGKLLTYQHRFEEFLQSLLDKKEEILTSYGMLLQSFSEIQCGIPVGFGYREPTGNGKEVFINSLLHGIII
jgi:hypothetical protein